MAGVLLPLLIIAGLTNTVLVLIVRDLLHQLRDMRADALERHLHDGVR